MRVFCSFRFLGVINQYSRKKSGKKMMKLNELKIIIGADD